MYAFVCYHFFFVFSFQAYFNGFFFVVSVLRLNSDFYGRLGHNLLYCLCIEGALPYSNYHEQI